MSNGGPPFDSNKAAFYLVAFVLLFQCIVVLIGVAMCIYYGPEIVAGKWKCDNDDKLAGLLNGALAAALAFAANFLRKDK
jgi:hypothetical protein